MKARITRRVLAAGLLASAGCAPLVQEAGRPGLDFVGPTLGANSFVAADGVRLPMSAWPAEGETKGVIVALHGMNDYAHAFHLAARWWAGQGIATYAYDQRGFGRGARRGVWGGTELLTQDLRTLTALVRARHAGVPVTVLGHSMGGAVAVAAFASEPPPDADRVILAAPAVWGWSRQALPNRIALWISAHLVPGWKITAPDWLAKRIQASDNFPVLLAMGRDPNLIFATRIDAIYGLVGLMQTADERIGQVKPPVLFLYGAHDEIIPEEAALHAAARLKPGDRSAYYPQGWHLLTRDKAGPVVWADVAAFALDARAPLPSGAPPVPGAGSAG